jgi:hypothetical protein
MKKELVNKLIDTTTGRVIFNEVVPEGVPSYQSTADQEEPEKGNW